MTRTTTNARPAKLVAAIALCVGACATAAFVVALRDARKNRVAFPNSTQALSRSMEPTLRGPRFQWRCQNCGAAFAISVDLEGIKNFESASELDDAKERAKKDFRERARSVECPFCATAARPEDAIFLDGDRVFFDPEDVAAPKRWELVFFRDAQGRPTLKRAVGLPGERVAIRNGDVYVDGEIPRRDRATIWATAAPVFPIELARADSRIAVSRVLRARDAQGALHSPLAAIANESPIPCWNGANASQPEFARDFMLRFDLRTTEEDGRFAILARRPFRALLVELDLAAREVQMGALDLDDDGKRNGKPFETLDVDDFADVAKARFDVSDGVARADTTRVELTTVDGEAALALDGDLIATVELGDLDEPRVVGIATPFALLGRASRVGAIELFRDLHYSSTETSREETLVPEDAHYVLGDNSPASLDSRFPDVGCARVERALRPRTSNSSSLTP